MRNKAEEVTAEALQLPQSERAALVETLLHSLSGEPEPSVEGAHLEEIRRRRAAAQAHPAELIDGEAALQRARAAVRK